MPELNPPRLRGVIAWRLMSAAALACLLLGVALRKGPAVDRLSAAPGAGPAIGSRAEVPRLPSAAQAAISRTVAGDMPAYEVNRSRGAFQAISRPQHLRARFARSGVTLSSGAVRVGLHLRAAGYGSAPDLVEDVTPSARANRVSYAHPRLSEWYVNGPAGVEQGFTVRAPSHERSGPLTLSLALSGNAQPSLSADRRDITLSRAGASSLHYRGLSARDATGRSLRSWLALASGTVLLRVDASGARYPLTIDPLVQQDEHPLPSGEAGEGRFGLSVALSADGGTALIGAPGDNGFEGAAWVFTRSGASWTQQGPKLTVGPAEGLGEAQCVEEATQCGFGRSVALSADGNTALIGRPSESGFRGAAWVFTRSESKWSQAGEALEGGVEETGNGRFGRSVALSADGQTALIGSTRDGADSGAAWVFTRSGSTFAQPGLKLTANEEIGAGHFGRAVTLSSDGSTALIGGPADNAYAGGAWVFTHSATGWDTQGTKLTGGAGENGPGRFGYSVALSAGGETALIGARNDAEGAGASWVFVRSGPGWVQQGLKLTSSEEEGTGQFGFSVALSATGNTALIGGQHDASSLGAAWLFSRSGTSWTQQGAKLVDRVTSDRGAFGTSVALAANGGTALIGAPRADGKLGAVWGLLGSPTVPSVTTISPSSGPTSGGTPVTIKGSGFLADATVQIGSAATAVTVLSETEITAVTAPSAAGSDEVVVTDLLGASTGGPSYEYVASPPASPGGSEAPVGGQALVAGAGASGALGSITTALPPPKLAVSGNLTPISGVVRVKLPGSAVFTLLTASEQIPFGSIVDATHGKVEVITARSGGGTQSVIFYEGEFKLTQRRNAQVVSILVGGDYSRCPTARERKHLASPSSARTARRRTVRKLWAEGHGKYSTKGNYASGAVLGTRWLTEDLCGGTLIRVLTDRVMVTNLVNHRHITVKAGHSYLAKAP